MTTPVYNPREIVTDGIYTAERRWQHLLKAIIALAIYAGARDGLGLTPMAAAVVASPLFMAVVTVKEWVWPSDPNQHAYPLALLIDDFITDACCTLPAVAVACRAVLGWPIALGVVVFGFIGYRVFRHGARP